MSVEATTNTAAADTGATGDAQAQAETKPDVAGAQEPKKETAAERKFRLKFGKTEREVDEKEVTMLAQKGWASDEKFKSAKAAERKAQEIVERADVEQLLLKKYGKSKLDWAKETLKEELKLRTMSPEEKEEYDRKSRIKSLEDKEAELIEREAERRLDAQTRRYQEQYDKEFAQALEKHKLPRNKYLMNRCVKIAQEIVANDMEPDWDLVVGEGKRQVMEEISEMFTEDEAGLGWVGEDRVRKLMKLLVGKITKEPGVAKIVRQVDSNKLDDKVPVDADSYWEAKRAQWNK